MQRIILLSCGVVLLPSSPLRPENRPVTLYSSEPHHEATENERIYTLNQIETLRKALPPRYVRVLDWRFYETRSGLNSGILFTFDGFQKKRVSVAGNFSNWKPVPMQRNRHGVYFYLLPIGEDEADLSVIHYRFMMDGIWTHDPVNQYRKDDGLGGYISEYRLESRDVNRTITVRTLEEEDGEENHERLVEFAIYLPEISNLSLVGTFNDWNPEHDFPVKGEDGIFRLRMRLRPGRYLYKYIADGKWILDRFNPDARYNAGYDELCSYLEVK